MGNGISRLLPYNSDFIKNWEGELWGCNYAFLTHGNQLTRLSGHRDIIKEAKIYRDNNRLQYKILARFYRRDNVAEIEITCPQELTKDTGTSIVAQALEEGWEKIYCIGFDIGGRDIHTPFLYKQNKQNWVKRWRTIFKYYGHERVEFIGFDHKKYLLSKDHYSKYYLKYRKNIPHFNDEDYKELYYGLYQAPIFKEDNQLVEIEFTDLSHKPGLKTKFKYSIAKKYENKGLVKIKEPEVQFVPAISPLIKKVKKRMQLYDLQRTAFYFGATNWNELTRTQALEIIRKGGNR
jgi:hypothetical protein